MSFMALYSIFRQQYSFNPGLSLVVDLSRRTWEERRVCVYAYVRKCLVSVVCHFAASWSAGYKIRFFQCCSVLLSAQCSVLLASGLAFIRKWEEGVERSLGISDPLKSRKKYPYNRNMLISDPTRAHIVWHIFLFVYNCKTLKKHLKFGFKALISLNIQCFSWMSSFEVNKIYFWELFSLEVHKTVKNMLISGKCMKKCINRMHITDHQMHWSL
jgi:hypothetical protein